MRAELTHDAGKPAEFPRDGLAEVAVLGRSNVGKSSLINALVGRRGLARTSGAPGKTRRIHFYRVAGTFYLVDLPGYGWARVSQSERRSWRTLAESYLRGAREALRGAILLLDARRGAEQEERELVEWLAYERIACAVALTKSDKLGRQQLAAAIERAAAELGAARATVCAVSSRTRAGLAEVAARIHDWTGTLLVRPDGGPL